MAYGKRAKIAVIFTFGLMVLVGCNQSSQKQSTTPTSISDSIPTASLLHPSYTPQPTTPVPTQSLTPAADLVGGSTMISPKDGMVLVYIPAGDFLMGSTGEDPDDALDEFPQHTVTLDAYWMDLTEVTNAMYQLCVKEGGCEPPSGNESYSRETYFADEQFDDYPVIYVSWVDAKAYCEWVGRRLPTEAEWEKAARGEDGRIYPWGSGINCQKANYWGQEGGCTGDTTPVGSYPDGASPYGVLDMAGNVWEWVSSIYKPYPYNPGDGREEMDSSKPRLLRGGSWYYATSKIVRTASRSRSDPGYTFFGVGFRCASSP